jgi:hypothetical protein
VFSLPFSLEGPLFSGEAYKEFPSLSLSLYAEGPSLTTCETARFRITSRNGGQIWEKGGKSWKESSGRHPPRALFPDMAPSQMYITLGKSWGCEDVLVVYNLGGCDAGQFSFFVHASRRH